MKKTKLVPITSLDQLEVGSVIVDKDGDRRKVLAKCGLIVWISCLNQPNRCYNNAWTLEELIGNKFQLKVTKEPWVPKEGETYYYPWINKGKINTDWSIWESEKETCREQLRVKLICKTKEEALAKAQKMLDSIKDLK